MMSRACDGFSAMTMAVMNNPFVETDFLESPWPLQAVS